MTESQTRGPEGHQAEGPRPAACPNCGQPIQGKDAADLMDRIAEDLSLEELIEWCTETLLCHAGDDALADFIVHAMRSREDLAIAVEERQEGEEEEDERVWDEEESLTTTG